VAPPPLLPSKDRVNLDGSASARARQEVAALQKSGPGELGWAALGAGTLASILFVLCACWVCRRKLCCPYAIPVKQRAAREITLSSLPMVNISSLSGTERSADLQTPRSTMTASSGPFATPRRFTLPTHDAPDRSNSSFSSSSAYRAFRDRLSLGAGVLSRGRRSSASNNGSSIAAQSVPALVSTVGAVSSSQVVAVHSLVSPEQGDPFPRNEGLATPPTADGENKHALPLAATPGVVPGAWSGASQPLAHISDEEAARQASQGVFVDGLDYSSVMRI